jgi:hypothetical protein
MTLSDSGSCSAQPDLAVTGSLLLQSQGKRVQTFDPTLPLHAKVGAPSFDTAKVAATP